MALQLVSPTPDPGDDLDGFDLSVAEIHDRVLAPSVEAFRAVSPLAPRAFRGQVRNATAVVGLRELLLSRGWEANDDEGVARVVHRERGLAIVVVTGNAATGRPTVPGGRGPSNRWPRGPLTREAVADNGQLALFEEDRGEADPAAEFLMHTWFLLVHADGTEVRVELSWPDQFTDGYVDHWGQRILLPALATGGPGDDLDSDDGGDTVDVPIVEL